MKNLLLALFCTLATVSTSWAEQFVNLTPRPMEMTVKEGQFTLPRHYTVATALVADSMKVEADRFVQSLNQCTGYEGTVVKKTKGNIVLRHDATLDNEAYRLTVDKKQVNIQASTTAGLFYALQSLRKMMPAEAYNEDRIATYVLQDGVITVPCVSINDQPRFWYRGFMLDCGRHFFSIDDIKHILDGMAIYKMNYFHWHLTEDQGWRFEVKKYPRLTEIGSVASDVRWNDFKGTYWLGKQYGPYYYTQDQCREIVEYARKLHIEVIPEIDMPGHIMAAMASYPEFSCNPEGEHKVTTHQGGIWSDVLNVGNPKAVQFARDILTEVMDVFPCQYVHIGGDECPTSAWERNPECQALLQQLLKDNVVPAECVYGEAAKTEHFTMAAEVETETKSDAKLNFRSLQSYFISQMDDHLKSRGRKMILWNESITANGSALDLVKNTGAIIFCWAPCQKAAQMASNMGLPCVITEWGPGCYYINRKQWDGKEEPHAAGYGGKGDQLPGVYNYVPVPETLSPAQQQFYVGVQATFWTEWVCDIDYVDYLAFPRLLAVAEAGWSPQSLKDFDHFQKRASADIRLFEMTGRKYGAHYLTK